MRCLVRPRSLTGERVASAPLEGPGVRCIAFEHHDVVVRAVLMAGRVCARKCGMVASLCAWVRAHIFCNKYAFASMF